MNLGVQEFDLLQIIPFGRSWANKDKLLYDIDEYLPFLQKAFSISKEKSVKIWTNRFPLKYLTGFEDLIQNPVKLYDEIGGRREIFNDFMNKGKLMHCRGDRCCFCFLEEFCNDLIELRKKRKSSSHPYPKCLRLHKKRITFKLQRGKNDIFTFISFFIKNRYFTKGSGCKQCIFVKKCFGMQCDYIRKHGFKCLAPIRLKSKEFNQETLKANIPYTILRLTPECNTACLFCNVPKESYVIENMTTRSAKHMIDKLISQDKDLRLDITGGEPTQRKDLGEIIRYARKKNISIVQIQTNCISLSDKEYALSLKNAGLNKAFVALHSSIPKIHDYLVGKKGALKKCIAGIKNLQELGIDVSLNPVITTKNYRYLPDYIKFIKTKFPKIKSVSLSVIQPRGRAAKNKFLIPRYSTIAPYIHKTLNLAKLYNLTLINPYCGVPLCIGGWHHNLKQCVEYSQNLIQIQSGFIKYEQNNDKIKGQRCYECSLYLFCNGVWKEYATFHGLKELKPIKLKNEKWPI
ncbi:radical SAM protein [Thermoproteota archaeon]